MATTLIIAHLDAIPDDIDDKIDKFIKRYNIMFKPNKGEPDDTILLLDKIASAVQSLSEIMCNLFTDLPGDDIKYLARLKDLKNEHYPITRVIIITTKTMSNRALYYDVLGNKISPDKVRFFFVDEDIVI